MEMTFSEYGELRKRLLEENLRSDISKKGRLFLDAFLASDDMFLMAIAVNMPEHARHRVDLKGIFTSYEIHYIKSYTSTISGLLTAAHHAAMGLKCRDSAIYDVLHMMLISTLIKIKDDLGPISETYTSMTNLMAAHE